METSILKTLSFNRATEAFEQAYREFLDAEGLAGSPVAAAGFFTAVLRMVKEDPASYQTMQPELINWLDERIGESLDKFHDRVEVLLVHISTPEV